jgi:hypothetical protein
LLAAVALTMAPATAQEPPPAGGGTVGSAKATAVVVKVAPTVGSLALALGSGISVAEVRNNLAQSQSQSLDLGLIGSTLTAEQCDGRDGVLRPSDLPQALRIDNRAGDASDQASFVPAGDLLDGLFQQVRATAAPFAEAVSTAARIGLDPLLSVSAGTATATTEVVDGGAARIAHAHVGVDLDLPGILELRNLQWDAYHRTGTEPDARASFTFGDIEVLGIPLPTSNLPLDSIVDTLNTLLSPLGLTITVPTVERFTEPADVVRITPLRIVFGNSPVTSVLTGPLLDASRELRDGLAAALVEITCRAATPMLVAEIILGQLSGTGSTVISIGGAEATTGLVDLENPFGEGALAPPTDPDGTIDAIPSVAPAGRPVTVPPPAGVVPPPPAIGPRDVATAPIGDFERVCESVHPFDWPSCSTGAAPFVGIAAVVATAAIAFLDWRHQRRRARAAATPAPEAVA